jgi:hypothetical protein
VQGRIPADTARRGLRQLDMRNQKQAGVLGVSVSGLAAAKPY